jgi:hypothetical protein
LFSSLLFLELLEKHPFLEESPQINLFWVLGHESYDPAFIYIHQGVWCGRLVCNFLDYTTLRAKCSGDDDRSIIHL